MKRYWVIGIGTLLVLGLAALLITARVLASRSEPYIRAQAIQYLQKRFNSEVEMAELNVRMPHFSAFRLLRTRGRGLTVQVEGKGIALRLQGRRDVPPLFTIKQVGFDVDLGTLLESPKRVSLVTLDGMEINIPPKGDRPSFEAGPESGSADTDVIIEEVIVNGATLKLLPKQDGKQPLQFDIHHLHLESAGIGKPMRYDASLTNAKPPGEILSQGSFGPWVAGEPGDTPLQGRYTFDDADLGVFDEIAGILASSGQFEGVLSTIDVRGEASVPDFRLKLSGNRVPLKTRFEVRVDGTNGNTILRPVVARLGTTDFTTSGGVIKHDEHRRRTISLDVEMHRGNLQDLLRLAMKGEPFMVGKIALKTKLGIPPLSGKVKEKLLLAGKFEVTDSKFLRSTIQEKIDTLSRRSQGQPKNEAIDEVVAGLKGAFELENQIITFQSLTFAVPGAAIDLSGSYEVGGEIDFRGSMALQARISQTMTGWKRWLLKPIDPFFARNGAGTFLRIRVEGTADDPQFGRDKRNN